MPQVFRTFVALDLSAGILKQAGSLIDRLRSTAAQVRWAHAGQMHLTLNFLGDVAVAGVTDVCQMVAEAAAQHTAFTVQVAGVGAFPSVDRPRVVWLGVTAGAEHVAALQRTLEAALEVAGFRPEERRFTPHVTIGRVKGLPRGDRTLADLLHREAACDCGKMPVGEVVVYSSTLSAQGPTYEVLSRARLQPAGT
ncbi:MAG: RNA 2',3'-cyclic phosphodiesterase [Pirellulales bacterium]|nr:RNA 2',3'-cyclic phosphodiesterase [Pirellulales bacterium]